MGWMLRRFKFWLGFRMSAKRASEPLPEAGDAMLLSGDMQSGTDRYLLSGDMQSGTDVALLSPQP